MTSAEVVINGRKFPLLSDELLPKGKRAWQRSQRPSQASDPGIPRTARWQLSGPVGNSREDTRNGVGPLGVDYTKGIDTLYDGLAIPGPKFEGIALSELGTPENVSLGDIARQYMMLLGPSAGWGLGESAGDALDLVGSLDGTVTIGDGERDTDALDSGGDGSITFDGAATNVQVTDGAAIQDIWDGGGFLAVIVEPTGTAASQAILDKAGGGTEGWTLLREDEAGALSLSVAFSGTSGTFAVWNSGSVLVTDEPNFIGIAYDSSSASNDPTIYVWNETNGLSTLTVGDGLTETNAPSGTYVSDAGSDLYIGSFAGLALDFAGAIDEVFLFNGSQPTAVAVEEYAELAGTSVVVANSSAALGGSPLGAAPLGGGAASSTVQTITHFDEDRGQLFFHGGPFTVQVDPDTFDPVNFSIHDASVRGAANWRNRGYLGLGSTAPMQRRKSVSGSGASYEDVQVSTADVFAGPIVVGPDRVWWVDTEDDDENNLRYSLDALQTMSNSFQVGDPGIPATGLGTYGRSALAGSEVGAFGFTDLGIPVRVLESLRGQRSPHNAKHIITLWGWTYITTTQGLKATIPGQVENPAGLPRSFEGKPQGMPTAIWPYKDSLFMAVKDVDGDTYIMRGEFGAETPGTGRPDWYPFLVLEDKDVEMLASTALRPSSTGSGLPTSTLLLGVGQNGGYVVLGRTERDIDDPDYQHTTGTLEWTGTTMMRDSNLHKNVRYFSTVLEDLDDGQSFQLKLKVDDADYVDVGSAVTTSGHHFIRPVSAGVPQTNVNGHQFKPRFVLTTTDADDPPKVRGTLDMVYDERPDTITEYSVAVVLGQRGYSAESDVAFLNDLIDGHDASSPFAFTDPNYPQTKHYGFAVRVEGIQDVVGDGVQTATVILHEWETA